MVRLLEQSLQLLDSCERLTYRPVLMPGLMSSVDGLAAW